MFNQIKQWLKSIKDKIQARKQKKSYRYQFLVAKAWVYFGYNYSSPEEFIKYMCEKAGQPNSVKHFISKFNDLYDKYGAYAIMNKFFVELSSEYQAALTDYAVKVYYLRAFKPSDEDKRILGI